ncbi:hypothetical protein K431DRAFT_223329, partial [Polychaeton citri CBS 116435]
MPLEDYTYEELAHSSDLRILRLQPAPIGDTTINCDLLTRSLKQIEDEGIKYEALTWCWGDGEFNETIRIHRPFTQSAEVQTCTKSVKQSLHQALLALRYEDRGRFLWIDAICIDQDNIDERNQQVPRMDTIYGQAVGVFMKRPWFSRRWVVQEISLAISAKVYCGRDSVDWNDFSDAVSLFVDAEAEDKRLSEVFKANEKYGHTPNFFGDVSSLGAALLVETTRNLFRTTGRKRVGLSSLENLVSRLSIFEVSDPKDAIYALLAVSRDSNPRSDKNLPDFSDHIKYADKPQQLQRALEILHKIRRYFPRWQSEEYEVDYNRHVIEVFRDFLSFSIRRADQSRALDIICRPWAPQHDKPLGSSTILKMHRRHADSLVGMPEYSQGNYSAAGTRTFNPQKLWFKRRKGSYSMYVEGFIIDKLDKIEEPSQAGNIPYAWLKYAEWKDKTKDPPAGPWERFWETLVASRGPNGQNPPTFYPRAFQQVLQVNPEHSTIVTSTIINEGPGRIVAKFLRRVLATIWERRLVQTKDGRLGLVDRKAARGDFVCILYGCSVPVILRRH